MEETQTPRAPASAPACVPPVVCVPPVLLLTQNNDKALSLLASPPKSPGVLMAEKLSKVTTPSPLAPLLSPARSLLQDPVKNG